MNRRSRIGTEIQNFAKWSKKTVYQRLVHMYQFVNGRSKIGAEILILAKTFQEGRVPNFGTNVPKVVFAYSAKDSGFCESEPKKSWRMLPAKWRKK